jgi:hypothetical protein
MTQSPNMKKFSHTSSILTTAHGLRNRWSILGWALLYILVAGALQLFIPFPLDSDAPYHAVVGQLMQKHGMLKAFPWTPFSWLSDNYADKELLFHVLFVPFSGLGWITAVRIVGTLSGATILLSLFLILRAEGVRSPGLWALMPLSCSILFIFRFSLVRPHLLSIALALVVLWAACQGRVVVLAVASAIYPIAYVAFWQIPCLLLFAVGAAHFLSDRRVQWKPFAAVACGIAVGVALHPNTGNLLHLNWIHMTHILFKRIVWGTQPGIDLGYEINPYPVAGWVQGLLFSVVMTIVATGYAWRNRQKEIISLAFSFAALGFSFLTMTTARFAEYFVPFSVAAMALASRPITQRFLPHAILGISILYTLWVGFPTLLDMKEQPNLMPQRIAIALQEKIPPGSQVFTTDWHHTGLLMLTLPERRFIVALDPTLFYLKDSELYRLWYSLTHDTPAGPAEIIRQRFRSRYVLSFYPDGPRRLFHQLSSEQGVRILLASDLWVLFDLGVSQRQKLPGN